MLNHKLVAACLAVLCLAGADTALAGPIIYFDELRAVRAGRESVTTDSDGLFVADVSTVTATLAASAYQSTSIGGGFVGGTGDATAANTNVGDYGASSLLSTRFILDETYTARIYVTLVAPDTYTQVYLTGPSGTMYFKQGGGIAEFAALLLPGTYGFGVQTNVGLYARNAYSGTGSFDGGLTLTPVNAAPVPEPATMTMLGIGLLAVTRNLRSRRKP